jgi:hypothetical protein
MEVTVEQVIAFARTLLNKSIPEACGSLMLAYEGMDLVSAKAAMLVAAIDRLWNLEVKPSMELMERREEAVWALEEDLMGTGGRTQ